MAAIKITNFGGEAPSISPRALGPDSSQENRNLLLSLSEFRPVSEDTLVAGAPLGTKSLYRFARKADGEFNTDPTTGWLTTNTERSYVKAQINDERTERTYLTTNDGSMPPRAIDVEGADRRLGVPRPLQPQVTLQASGELTREEADVFLYSTVVGALKQSLIVSTLPLTDEPKSRYGGSATIPTAPYGGPLSFHGAFTSASFTGHPFANNHWQAYFPVLNNSNVWRALDQLTLGVFTQSTTAVYAYVPLSMLPAVFRPDWAKVATEIRKIEYPDSAGEKAGSKVFSEAQITSIIGYLTKEFNSAEYAKTERDKMEELAKEFKALLASTIGSGTPRPVEPTRPTVPELTGGWEDQVRAPQWVAYDAAYQQYLLDLEAWKAANVENSITATELNARLSAIQNEMELLTQAIERKTYSVAGKWAFEGNGFSDYITSLGGVSEIIGDTVERIIDTRFYVVTFVTDWGEESEPSPVTDLLEVDQNDSVTIERPNSSSGETLATRNIIKWRIYRSNVGSQSAAFQFVEELLTSAGSYTDAKKGEELGEVCPTTTWAEPPYRMDAQFDGYPKPIKGDNPHLRGLIGMPNGIMAGFIDNTVAFCEPYVPYAWPVEYQITTEHPIVGLGVFGTTLFVGTTGNPYFISGSDSASMSGQKIDSNQSCVSAKSIASVQGGVLYASPDGLCLASPNGINVVSRGLYTREDWQALNPSSMFAAEHEGIYYLFYDNGTKGCLSFDLPSKKLGEVDLWADAVFVDSFNDTMYVAQGTAIRAVFGAEARRTGKWKSGRQVLPKFESLAWVQVYGDQTADAPVIVRWFGDGVLRHTATLTDTKPQRLPAGRWVEHEVEVESKSRVTSVMLASSTGELQAI